MSTASFVGLGTNQGFDAAASPPWQMVPWGGIKLVGLVGGAGLTISSTSPSVAFAWDVGSDPLSGVAGTMLRAVAPGAVAAANLVVTAFRAILSSLNARPIAIFGVRRGTAHIQAKRGSTTVCQMEAAVKSRKTVKVAFNFVRDSANHRTTRALASAGGWVNTINGILAPQTNVTCTRQSARWVTVNRDLGDEVRWQPRNAAQHDWPHVIAQRDRAADVNIFLLWEYEQDADASTDIADAAALGGNIMFEDHAGTEVGETMAHEIGHCLGVGDFYGSAQRNWLMYGITDVRGRHIPKAHANTMNRG